jgi:transposase
MVRLANNGWSIPKIAQHFEITESRVRHWIESFLSGGFDSLSDRKGAGVKLRLSASVLGEIRRSTGQGGQTWTAGQVNEWVLANHGFSLNVRYLAEVLNKNGLSYKRTTRTIRHKQNPEQVRSKKADLATLKKGQNLD